MTISVITNSKGHNKTPQVKLNDNPFSPNKDKFAGDKPNTPSNENIFPPIHSAIKALATKKAEIPKNNLESYNPNLNYPNCPKIQTCKYNDFIESKIRLLLHTIGSITTEISVKISEILEISNYMEKNNICSELVTNVEKLIKKQKVLH